MKRSTIPALLALAATWATTADAEEAAPLSAAEEDERQRLYEESKQHRIAEEWSACYDKMKRAVAIERTPGTTSLYGTCAVRVGDMVDGARFLSLARKENLPDSVLAELEQHRTMALAAVAAVNVTVQPEAADLTVDGQPAELIDGVVFLLPGEHTFVATFTDHEPARADRAFAAGQQASLELVLVPTSTATPQHPEEAPSTAAVSWAVPIALGAVGLVGIGVGVAGELLRGDARTDYDAALARLPAGDGACRAPTGAIAADCAAVDDAIAAHNRHRAMEIAGFAVGGAALVAAAITIPFAAADDGAEENANPVSATLTPACGSAFCGVLVRGTW